MIPQGVMLHDMVKPIIQHQAESTGTVRKQNMDRVDLTGRAGSRGEKSGPLSLEKAVDKSNKMAEAMNSHVRFKVDDSTNQVIVQVVNRETDKVIRQFPSEEMIRLASRAEELRGLIYNNEG